MEKADCHTRHSLFSLCLQRDDDSSSSFCRPGLTRPRHKKIPERLFIGLIFLLCSSCEVDIFSVLLTSCSAARKPPPPRTHGSGDSISSEFPRSQPTDPSPPLHAKHRQKRGQFEPGRDCAQTSQSASHPRSTSGRRTTRSWHVHCI